jgi:hypothetical protein
VLKQYIIKIGALMVTEQIKEMITNESLAKLLRSNLSCYLGENITRDKLDKMALDIVESIDFVLNNPDIKASTIL